MNNMLDWPFSGVLICPYNDGYRCLISFAIAHPCFSHQFVYTEYANSSFKVKYLMRNNQFTDEM